MNNTKRSKAGVGLAGAVAVASASQAYAAIIQVTPPTNVVGVFNKPVSEYWDAETGTSSATNVTGVSDFKFQIQNSDISNNGQPLYAAYSFIANRTGATTAGTRGTYPVSSFAFNIPSGKTIGTGGNYSYFNAVASGSLRLSGVTAAGNQTTYIPTGKPAYVGFQFTAADGMLHDGYVQVQTDPYTSSTSPGGLTFFSAAYNSVPNAQGGTIAAGATAVPEPGTLSALAAGAAILAGVGRGRRRAATCAAA